MMMNDLTVCRPIGDLEIGHCHPSKKDDDYVNEEDAFVDAEQGDTDSYYSTSSTHTRLDHHHRHLLRCRTIQPQDRIQIQALHEEWFPVEYQEEFYNDLVKGKMCHTGEPLYTNVLVDERDEIVACLVGTSIPRNRLNHLSRQLLLPDGQHDRLFYIMTLGTVTEYRKAGLASSLIQQCIDEVVLPDEECGVLYLHVITMNDAAIRFYERLGFWRVQEIPDYYTIDGKHYNCYLYAKYFHGTLLLALITAL